MSPLRLILMLGALLGAVAGCRTKDYRRALIHVPEMRTPAAAERVRAALLQLPGIRVDKLTLDTQRQLVLVVYDSLEVALKNMEHVIADAGFSANDVPARPDAAAALPPALRGTALPPAFSNAVSPVVPTRVRPTATEAGGRR